MPNSKNQQRRGSEEKNRRGRLSQKSSSFHSGMSASMTPELRRPKTVPDLLSFRGVPVAVPEDSPAEMQPRARLTKLLLNVTIRGSLGAVQVIMSPESTVGDLVAAAIRQYAKEGRRPILPSTDPSAFGLHYSQFSLESLDREEKLMAMLHQYSTGAQRMRTENVLNTYTLRIRIEYGSLLKQGVYAYICGKKIDS